MERIPTNKAKKIIISTVPDTINPENFSKYDHTLYYSSEFKQGIEPRKYNHFKKTNKDYSEKHKAFADSRTVKGSIYQLWASHRRYCVVNNQTLPTYTRADLYTWFMQQQGVVEQFESWIKSGYSVKLKPTAYLLSKNKGHTLENLKYTVNSQLVEQRTKDRKLGYISNTSVPVDMLDKKGNFVKKFVSQKQAERWLRDNGYPKASQSAIVQYLRKNSSALSCYGHLWRHSIAIN